MNRRQVLLGAGASAVAISGWSSWLGAQGGAGVNFLPFTQGIRGSYTLLGGVTLVGSIPVVPGQEAPAPTPTPSSTGHLTPMPPMPPMPPSGGSTPQATGFSAPARPPMMSIVPVPRGAGRREASTLN